jgi:hypothetical protein
LEEDFKKEEAERSIFYQSYLSASSTMNSSSTLSYKSSTSPSLSQTQPQYSTLQNHHLHHNNINHHHHQNGNSNSGSPTAGTPVMTSAVHVNGQNGQHMPNFWWNNGAAVNGAGDGTSSSSNSSTGDTPYGTSSSNGLMANTNFIFSPQKPLIANNRKANDY